MAHQERSIRERVIALAEKGGLSASTAGERYGVLLSTAREWLRKYRRDGQVGRRKGTGLWRVSSPAQDAALVAEAQRNPFFSARDLKAATGFPGQKDAIISRLKAAGLRARHAAVKELLTDEHKLYRLAFAESNVDRKWDRVIFTDESTFSSSNDGPVLVYRPQGERYSPQYMSTCKRSGRVSVNCWGWISHEGVGVIHRIEGHMDGLQYQHILQNVIVPSVQMLYPNGVIHLQLDHTSIHDSGVVQEWLSHQADVELIDWPPRAPDMNPIENMWSEVKRTMQETWPDSPPRNSDELWALVSNTWDAVAESQRYIRSLIESMTQ
jgi:transposase